MTSRATSFGAVAAAYERFRPGYPDELVDLVLDYAGQPVRTALEIGAGTGKATRAFAARGIAVTATDPDAAMLTELRRHVPDTVTVRQGTLEQLDQPDDLDPAGGFDLVFAAAALHWTDPATRWSRISRLLGSRGVFASFGGPMDLADPDLDATVADITRPYLGGDHHIPAPDGTAADSAMQWPGSELLTVSGFTDIRQETIARAVPLSRDDFIGHLGTISAYLQLPQRDRAEVLEQVRAVLPARVTLRADLIVHLARLTAPVGRAPRPAS
ncbi:class I SAM-dependent methyltransferase [Flexivirga sp. ID2601S]|uniref:Class I SAM-dependent methyltransferase n=1 Tax=Flexivirga aerilata TaxID=1656889 RepID=A0A849AC00_9MICO|nr:class I SAM-dependent methyltransferase [Flexivirga aerilata]NNG38424.1 class I SAM-dependent methyltransferase [Flexivirga aerilata]